MGTNPFKSDKVRWGVLGVASIAVRRVIPAMQKGARSEIAAIASRDGSKAKRAARDLGIPKAYGSYDELLADPEIDAIYNPLPNHLHVPWSIRAAEAGKHVLCEKPIGLTSGEAKSLLEIRDRTGVKVAEAFMVRCHPRWLRVRDLIAGGRIGQVGAIHTTLAYFNRDPQNVRNISAYGGGALLDIGCYAVTLSRFIFGAEPEHILGLVERDPEMGTDRLTSAILEFPGGRSLFTCSTQLSYFQGMQLHGANGTIELDKLINPATEQPSRIVIYEGPDRFADSAIIETIDACNQFTIQGDLFSQAIRENGEVPVPLEDSIRNMQVIEAIFRSAESGQWEKPH
jgi:predicted dehydrogenase